MATLTEYFETEARDALGQMQRELARPTPDAGVLLRAARALRGVAQMAREERVLDAARSFEAAMRAAAAADAAFPEDLAAAARATVEDLFTLLQRDASDEDQQSLVQAVRDRWSDLVSAGQTQNAATPADFGAEEFRRFAAREIAEIAGALDAGLQQLTTDPMDREPLKLVLRRQRALLGSARLEEIVVVAEILRAVEDLTRVVARLNIGVKQEWLDIYRVARDGLRAAVEPLQRNENPQPSHAASRLRHIRTELLERYGDPGNASFSNEPAGAAVSNAGGSEEEAVLELSDELIVEEGPQEQTATADGAPDELLDVELLMYDRDAALRRALELRDVIARATAADPVAREATDEVFDLIRLALE